LQKKAQDMFPVFPVARGFGEIVASGRYMLGDCAREMIILPPGAPSILPVPGVAGGGAAIAGGSWGHGWRGRGRKVERQATFRTNENGETTPQCDPGFTFNPETHKCQTQCDFGLVWDAATQQCVPETPPNVCLGDQHWDPIVGACVSNEGPNVCGPDEHYDSTLGACVSNEGPNVCGPTEHYDSTLGACVSDLPPNVCLPGQELDANGNCVSIPNICLPGQTLDSTGNCVSICSPGQTYDVASGQCVSEVSFCGPGLVWNASMNQCEPEVSICSPGEVWNSELGQCVPEVSICPAGQVWNSEMNECVPQVTCREHEIFDPHTGMCIPAEIRIPEECGEGYIWSEEKNQCVKEGEEEEGEENEEHHPGTHCDWGPAWYCADAKRFSKCATGDYEKDAICKPIVDGWNKECADRGPKFWCKPCNFKKCVTRLGFTGKMVDFAACKPRLGGKCRRCGKKIVNVYNINACHCARKKGDGSGNGPVTK
jgi:hypothetical protein